MRSPMVVLLATQGFVISVSALFWLAVRPSLLADYAKADAALPGASQIALSSWWLPGVIALALAMVGGAFVLPRGSRRMRLVSASLIISGLAFMFAVAAGSAPLFAP